MLRTFLAVELSEPLRTTLATLQSELKQRVAKELTRDVSISWVRPVSLHLTVKFLGDIDEGLVLPLKGALTEVLRLHRAIEVPVNRLGAFPRPQQPRVLWAGPSEQWEAGEDAARLAGLHRAIDACCETLNLAPDSRSLSAHLTLARVKAGERVVGQLLARSGVMDRPFTCESLDVNAIALMKSDLKPTGSVYTKLWEVRL
ncbi:MAG: putative 2-5 ligase [Nitrospira sp.]|nr:putative 2-5 ligase [Nitrospira sp.]